MKQIVDKLNDIAKAIDENVEIPQSDLIIDSLDAITKALGGTPNDSNLIVDKLDDIAKVATGGGGGGETEMHIYTLNNPEAITIGAGSTGLAYVTAGYYCDEGTEPLIILDLFYNNYFGVKPTISAFLGEATSEGAGYEFYLYNPTNDSITIGAGKMAVTVGCLKELIPY